MDLHVSPSRSAETPSPEALRRQIAMLAGNVSIETTTRESETVGSYRAWLRPGMDVNIASVPGGDYSAVVRTAVRLRSEGFNPVPHLPARAFPSELALREALRRLRDEAGTSAALAIAGGNSDASGPFADSLSLLESGLLAEFGIHRIGVAGYPEGSPNIEDTALRNALAAKHAYARRTGVDMHIATQFCVDAGPIAAWAQSVRRDGIDLPIDVGVAGTTTLASLLKFARICGVNASGRVLARNARKLVRLGALSYPDRVIAGIANHMLLDPAHGIRRLHMFPFGGLERTARWLTAVAEGAFAFNERMDGFSVAI